MGIPFADAALSSPAGEVTQDRKKSLLPELNRSGFVVFWACTVLEVCRCLRGLAAE